MDHSSDPHPRYCMSLTEQRVLSHPPETITGIEELLKLFSLFKIQARNSYAFPSPSFCYVNGWDCKYGPNCSMGFYFSIASAHSHQGLRVPICLEESLNPSNCDVNDQYIHTPF
jgi:hypothetical protein